VDDDNPELSMMARRGYGGIAILWKKEIDDKIQMLNEGNNRVQVIQIDTECRPVCLINIYMPSDSKEHNYEYNNMLSQLAEILHKFSETHDIVLCGDLNGSLHREKTLHDDLLQKFFKEHGVKIEPSYSEKSTFYHHNGKSEGQIDYIISIGKSMSVNILDMENTNTSHHVPSIANMECHLLRRKEKPKLLKPKIKWNKCDTEIYRSTIAEGVNNMLSKINGNVEDNIVAMEQVLHEVSSKSIPNYSSEIRQKPTGKSIWNRGIAKAARNARKSHRIWKEGGAPKDRTDPLKVQKITAKRLLRKTQRQAYASNRNSWARKIMDASTTDTKLFHTLINKQRGGKSQNTKNSYYGV
jgi:hypothetical protein